MKHYYIDHLYGGLYSSNHKLTFDELYCEECGDSDFYLGSFETEEEAEQAHREYINAFIS